MLADGGYDAGYDSTPCFWGREPGSLIAPLIALAGNVAGLAVIDAGCGEGKNAQYLAERGAQVTGYEISEAAIKNAARVCVNPHVTIINADIRDLTLLPNSIDIAIMYGLLHCLTSREEIVDTVRKLQRATRPGGYHVVCAFNDRKQDLTAHPGFNPCLVSHQFYLSLYEDWEFCETSDSDLTETHPNNNLVHTHSMTRFIARSATLTTGKPGNERAR